MTVATSLLRSVAARLKKFGHGGVAPPGGDPAAARGGGIAAAWPDQPARRGGVRRLKMGSPDVHRRPAPETPRLSPTNWGLMSGAPRSQGASCRTAAARSATRRPALAAAGTLPGLPNRRRRDADVAPPVALIRNRLLDVRTPGERAVDVTGRTTACPSPSTRPGC